MILEIKKRLDSQISAYIRNLEKSYALAKISPLLYTSIKNFISRKGKRIRPIMFIIGYLGFAKKAAPGLYRSAISLELLHDFILVHDDIIDKSPLRRGKPSMHEMLNGYLKEYKNIKFNGQDLAIMAGDVIYAMALDTYLSVKEDSRRKELALKKFIHTALCTGGGEFAELLYGAKGLNEIKKEDIYKIYDLKTANYTFAAPLCMGATLAGARKQTLAKISGTGICLGRAFQIKDDIIGLFEKKNTTGKSNITDVQEAKKTILIWHAYKNSGNKDRAKIEVIFSKKIVCNSDLPVIRDIVTTTGTLEYAKKEISTLLDRAGHPEALSGMRPEYRDSLLTYSKEMLLI